MTPRRGKKPEQEEPALPDTASRGKSRSEMARGLIGAAIRHHRELSQISVRELARMSQISNAYLSQIERGLHEPSLRVVQAVSEALSLPLEELLPPGGAGRGDGDEDSVEAAINGASGLRPEQKDALVAVYRSYLAQNS